MANKKKLFENFPPVSTGEWVEKIKADLKGADFSRKMVWRTREGFEVNPFYRSDDLKKISYREALSPLLQKSHGPATPPNKWLVRQNIEVTNYRDANRKAISLLERGVESLGFIIEDPGSVDSPNFKVLLENICLRETEINFLCNGKAIEILEIFAGLASERGYLPGDVRGAIEADPLGRLMMNGTLCIPVGSGLDYLALLMKKSSLLPFYRILQINGTNFVNAGATVVQELAFSMSMACEYLSALTDRGLSPDYVSSKMRFSFGTGPGYFMEIAKLRAARLLWPLIIKGFNPDRPESSKIVIHCTTGRFNKTLYDPWVNILRTETEAMSAVLGGADSLTVDPFDITFKKPDEFSERIARNQQLILREEAYFDRVGDPAAGSYYVENLTELLIDHAWSLFTDIEDKGGFLNCLISGHIQEKLKESAEKRKNDIARGREIVVGTNRFPDSNEVVDPGIPVGGITGSKISGENLMFEPVSHFRASEEFEKLRLSVGRASKRPLVFILSAGNPVMRKVRSQFSADFFATAGYKIMESQGFDSAEDGIRAAVGSNADIVVVCSSDEEYLTLAPTVRERLKNRSIVVVAGNPESMDDLKSKGVDLFISLKSDMVETLKSINSLLGIDQG